MSYNSTRLTNYLDYFSLDENYNRKIDQIYEMLNNPNSDFKNQTISSNTISLFDTIDLTGIETNIMQRFFTSGINLHKNMLPEQNCQYEPRRTLDEEIQYELDHNLLPAISRDPNNVAQLNICATRLNNVQVVNFNGTNYIVKRLTRFTEKQRRDIDFIGSKCGKLEKEQMSKGFKNLQNTVSQFRDTECEFKELFTNLVLTYYLNQIYGNISPITYGVLIVNRNQYTEQEVFLISETMTVTVEQWFVNEISQLEIDDWFINMIYLSDCIHLNPLPKQLVERFSWLLYPYEFKNSRYYQLTKKETSNVFIHFYDCKLDNIMKDSNNKWRVIDVDGLMTATEPKTLGQNYLSVCLLSCGLDFSSVAFGINTNLFTILSDNGNLEKIRNSISRYDTLPNIDRLIGSVRKREYADLIIQKFLEMITPVNDFYTKYIKYKNKYLKLKNKRL
jgi:hypothetical protein